MGPESSDSVSVRFRPLGSIFRQLFGIFSTALSGISSTAAKFYFDSLSAALGQLFGTF